MSIFPNATEENRKSFKRNLEEFEVEGYGGDTEKVKIPQDKSQRYNGENVANQRAYQTKVIFVTNVTKMIS